MNKEQMQNQLNKIQNRKTSSKNKVVTLIDSYHEIEDLTDADEQDRIDIRHQVLAILNTMHTTIPKKLKLSLPSVVYDYEDWKEKRKIWT